MHALTEHGPAHDAVRIALMHCGDLKDTYDDIANSIRKYRTKWRLEGRMANDRECNDMHTLLSNPKMRDMYLEYCKRCSKSIQTTRIDILATHAFQKSGFQGRLQERTLFANYLDPNVVHSHKVIDSSFIGRSFCGMCFAYFARDGKSIDLHLTIDPTDSYGDYAIPRVANCVVTGWSHWFPDAPLDHDGMVYDIVVKLGHSFGPKTDSRMRTNHFGMACLGLLSSDI
jgi:hypothetical protein